MHRATVTEVIEGNGVVTVKWSDTHGLVLPAYAPMSNVVRKGTRLELRAVCGEDAWHGAPDDAFDIRLRGHVFASSETTTTVSVGGLLCDLFPLPNPHNVAKCRIDVTVV